MEAKQENLLSKESFLELSEYLVYAQEIAKRLNLKHKDANVLIEIIREVYQIEICRQKLEAIQKMTANKSSGGGCGESCGCTGSEDEPEGWEISDE